jgi:hypothetical protein
VWAGVLLVVRHRAGQRGVAAALSAALIAVNAAVGPATRSDTAYLAQGVVVAAAMGMAFGLSAATRRPLAGVLAADIYALPAEVWEERRFVRTFRVVSLVWAGFEALSASARGLALSSTGTFVLVSVVLGVPGTVALFWWSVRYADRRLT